MAGASIQFLGHSAVLVTTEGGKKVLIDPYLKGNPTAPSEDPGKIDTIVLTHGHGDHVSSTLDLLARYSPIFCATFELGQLLIRDGAQEALYQPMNKGGTITLPFGIAVTLTHAMHSSSYDAKDGKTYYAGEPCGAVIRLESGRTIYHAGDTALFSDMRLIGEEFMPEAALLPIGDRFTMGPVQAAKAVQLIKPKIAIPIHHSTFGLLTGTPEEFVMACAGSETKVEVLKPGETLAL